MEGFGSEVSIATVALLALKVARDFVKERREKQHAVKVINGDNRGNPGNNLGKGGSSTGIVLHMLKEHGEKLHKLDENFHKLEEGMMNVRVDLAKIETRLDMKEEKS